MTTLLDRAIKFATSRHTGQVDKGGQMYILHVLRVMADVAHAHPLDEPLQAAAVLHDVVEDCGVPITDLADRFGDEVADIVAHCTRDKVNNESYRAFIHRAKAHPKARIVKIADVLDNMDETRMARIPSEQVRKMLRERYAKALTWLEA